MVLQNKYKRATSAKYQYHRQLPSTTPPATPSPPILASNDLPPTALVETEEELIESAKREQEQLDYDKAEATELAAFQFKQRTALLLATTSTSSLASWTHPSATSDNSNDRDDSFNYLPSSAHNVNTYKTSIARLKTIAAPSTETATKVSDRVKAARDFKQRLDTNYAPRIEASSIESFFDELGLE